MDESELNQLAQVALRVAGIPDSPGLYAIGPFGRRVSFSAQQRRALNTVWALGRSGLRAGDRVAVIGGGFAGITTASALATYKSVVHLFETKARVCDLQARADHRYVHPTLGLWPLLPLNPTTNLPFLNWYCGRADKISGRIRNEWLGSFRKFVNRLHASTTVTGVNSVGDKWEVETNKSGLNLPEFKFVIFCCGFGDEIQVDGASNFSYWSSSDDPFVTDGEPPSSAIVTGIGDGGLIDALRAVHNHFDGGRLASRVASSIDHSGIGNLIADFEQSFANLPDDTDDSSARAALFYSQILTETPPAVLQILNDSLSRDRKATVVGRLAQPYSVRSAAIHRYMTAHAIEAGVLNYRQGDVVAGPSLQGSPPENLIADVVVPRHGTKVPLEMLLSKATSDAVKLNQANISDLLADLPVGMIDASVAGYPKQGPSELAFANAQFKQAQDCARQEFDAELSCSVDHGVPEYIIEEPPAPWDTDKSVPPSMFGISVRAARPEVIASFA